jgi:hypothetical protein
VCAELGLVLRLFRARSKTHRSPVPILRETMDVNGISYCEWLNHHLPYLHCIEN